MNKLIRAICNPEKKQRFYLNIAAYGVLLSAIVLAGLWNEPLVGFTGIIGFILLRPHWPDIRV